MNRVVHTSPSGTCTLTLPNGSIVAEGTYSDLRIEVEDKIHGGDEPTEFEVRKDGGDGILFLQTDEVGADLPRRPKPPRMEVAFKPGGGVIVRDAAGRFIPIDEAGSSGWRRRPKRDEVLTFSSGRQDPPIENRKQRRAREAKERRSKHA